MDTRPFAVYQTIEIDLEAIVDRLGRGITGGTITPLFQTHLLTRHRRKTRKAMAPNAKQLSKQLHVGYNRLPHHQEPRTQSEISGRG